MERYYETDVKKLRKKNKGINSLKNQGKRQIIDFITRNKMFYYKSDEKQ